MLPILFALAFAVAEDPPPELGHVAWSRDYAAGLARVRESGRPMLLLFQEVPG